MKRREGGKGELPGYWNISLPGEVKKTPIVTTWSHQPKKGGGVICGGGETGEVNPHGVKECLLWN